MKTTDRGEPQRFLLAHVDHQSDECVTWPYADDGHGYGHLHFDGVMVKAHRKMCLLVNGPPPAPKAEAAHSCGRGHFGCINPNHLRWASPAENQWDKLGHGTDNRGERCGSHKLVESEVMEIDILLASRALTHHAIADRYGVHRCTITDIAKGKNWSWLTGRVHPDNPVKPTPLMAANDNEPQRSVA